MADVKLEAREKSQKALTMTIAAADLQKAYGEKLAKYAREMTFKGFRKGKAPIDFVTRQIGDYVREEVVYDTIDSTFNAEVEKLAMEDRPLPYAKASIEGEDKLKDYKLGEDLTVTIAYDVFPAVELGQYKGLELEVLDGQVTDADIDAEVESLREQNANIMNKEGEAKLGDIATVDYAELDEAGVAIEATKRNDFTFTLGSSYNQYKIDDEVVGMKVGDQKTVDKSYGEDFSDESLRGRSVKLSITLMRDFSIRTETRNQLRQMGYDAQTVDRMMEENDNTVLYFQTLIAQRVDTNLADQVIMHAIQQSGAITLGEGELDKAVEEQLKGEMSDEEKKAATENIKMDLEFAKVPDFLLENNSFKPTGDKLDYRAYSKAYYDRLYSADKDEETSASEE